MGNDAPHRVPNFSDELTAKAFGLLFVEPGSAINSSSTSGWKTALLTEAMRGPSERPLLLA